MSHWRVEVDGAEVDGVDERDAMDGRIGAAGRPGGRGRFGRAKAPFQAPRKLSASARRASL